MSKDIKKENAEAVVEALSKTEKFFNQYGKLIAGVAAGVVVVAIAVFCYVSSFTSQQWLRQRVRWLLQSRTSAQLTTR